MGKKRVIQKGETEVKTSESKSRESSISQKVSRGVAHIQATYNNTIISVSDTAGNVLAWSSSGSLGFNGAKKATPYAAADLPLLKWAQSLLRHFLLFTLSQKPLMK